LRDSAQAAAAKTGTVKIAKLKTTTRLKRLRKKCTFPTGSAKPIAHTSK